MPVRFTNKVERVRRPDGTREALPGGSPTTGLGALATASTSPIRGAALAAARAPVIEPATSATICFESTGTLPYEFADDDSVRAVVVGYGDDGSAWRGRPGTSPAPNVGHRRNAVWKVLQADRGRADAGFEASPYDDTRDAYDAGAPMVLYPSGAGLARAVPNPEATTGTAWSVTGGTYSRVTGQNTLPDLGLPNPGGAHRVTSTPTALPTVTSPATPVRYYLAPGRAFTAAVWVTSNVTINAYRLRVVFTRGSDTVTMTSSPTTVAGPTRVVGTVVVPAGMGLDFTAPFTSVRVTLERVTANLAPARPASVWVDFRGMHLYAGGDRGDTAGLSAVPLTVELAVDVTVPEPMRFRVSRVDVHGSDTYGHPTAITATRDGVRAQAESAGRITARWAGGVIPTGPVRVVVEETSTGVGGDVYLTSVELLNEVDVSDRVVGLTVDRAADADPADSTVPIGNYAATTCTIELDNTDRGLSPFRAAYIDLGHRLEVAAGVVYTNRHGDPAGEGTGTADRVAPWVGNLVPVVVDSQGAIAPGARAMLVTDRGGAAAVQGPGVAGWRVRMGVWALGGVTPANLTIGYRNTNGVAPLTPHVIPAGAPWRWYEATGTLPADATMTAMTADPGVALAAPSIVRLEPATGDVVEVVETAPLGVFTTTEWPTATDEDTVTVPAVDVLGETADHPYLWPRLPGEDPVAPDVVVRQTIGETLGQVFRRYLDRGDDQVTIAAGTPVVPYVIPADTVGTMVADLAKGAALTAHTDGTGRPTAVPRDATETVVSAEYRHDTALIRAAVPFTPSLIRNDVTVIGSSLTVTPADEVVATVGNDERTLFEAGTPWVYTGREVPIPAGGAVDVRVEWAGHAAVLAGTLDPVYAYNADPSNGPVPVDVTATLTVHPRYGVVRFTAPTGAPAAVVDHVTIRGTALVEEEVTSRHVRASSVVKYGTHPVDVRVRLGATPGQLAVVGNDVLDNYSLRDTTDERWLPDLEVTTLGDPWRDLGDRVLTYEPRSGLAGEFRVVSHVLDIGQAARSTLYLRRVRTGLVFAVADRSTADGPHVAAY